MCMKGQNKALIYVMKKVVFVLITFSKMCIASLCFMSLLHIYFFFKSEQNTENTFFSTNLKIVLDVFLFLMSP